jgi:hypothetical protein
LHILLSIDQNRPTHIAKESGRYSRRHLPSKTRCLCALYAFLKATAFTPPLLNLLGKKSAEAFTVVQTPLRARRRAFVCRAVKLAGDRHHCKLFKRRRSPWGIRGLARLCYIPLMTHHGQEEKRILKVSMMQSQVAVSDGRHEETVQSLARMHTS